MKLSDRIWLTRKCRIETASRFDRYDIVSKLSITYYSAFIIILSLYNNSSSEINYSFSITSASILILIVSLLVTSMKFKERALAHKQCYIKLHELQYEAQKIEKTGDSDIDLFRSYNEVLNLTENHSVYDYLKVKFYDKSEEEHLSITWKGLLKLFAYWIYNIIFLLIIVVLPFVILYFEN